ncbi:MAG: hypothetical protein HUK02_09950 [Bacteroidaceae bacterium]|nr:hypothetical protein [Bacteroidaceae bacterium]
MKTTKQTLRLLGLMLVALLFGTTASMAQNKGKKTAKNELAGVWVMESMQFEGEKKTICGKNSGYAQVKYHGADGEYACAEIVTDGKTYNILPHEYGTYTYKDGVYTEMGRKPSPLSLSADGKHYYSQWLTRHDVWVRCTDMPKELIDDIIYRCKAAQTPSAKVQQMIKQSFFSK